MAASDLFVEVGDPGSATTLDSNYTAGDSSVTVVSTSNWPSTGKAVIFAIDEVTIVDGEEVQTAGTYNEFEGTVASATSVSNVDWKRGSGDRDYSAGTSTRVYIPVSAERENRLVEGMSAEHNATDGKHSDITADSLTINSGGSVDFSNAQLATTDYGDGTVTNAKLNTDTGELGGAWQTWSPTYTGITVGNGTVVSKYTQIGKTVIAHFDLQFGSTTSVSGSVTVSLPLAVSSQYSSSVDPMLSTCRFTDSGSQTVEGVVRYSSSTGVQLQHLDVNGTLLRATALSSTAPFTWTTGDRIHFSICYEAA